MKKALFWKAKSDNTVTCSLCAHNCKIKAGKTGICKVRLNKNGTLYTITYGLASPGVIDPIEKKPLYHFYPGSKVYSFGTISCNFKCANCQNWQISQVTPNESLIKPIPPAKAINMAMELNCQGVAWTYNEPTIWFEYTYMGSKIAKRFGLYSVYVTNGYMNPEPLKKIAPYLDALNIDVKAFSEDFYRKICKSHLEPVLKTAELAVKLKKHVEITNLVIPTLNDDPDDIKKLVDWVYTKLGANTPVHFSRFHPDNKLPHIPRTPEKTLVNAYKIAKSAGLKYVFLGNIYHPRYGNTYCPNCNQLVLRRGSTFGIKNNYLSNGHCPKCNEKIMVFA
jgi:pyruvate formate lyase activating enzyme